MVAPPPLGLSALAWIAPVWWVMLVRRKELPALSSTSPTIRPIVLAILSIMVFLAAMAVAGVVHEYKFRGFWATELVVWPAALWLSALHRRWRDRPYWTLWLAGLLFWLATLNWLRFPHWATGLGWLAMSCYFAVYFPLFVGLSRVAVHRFRVPVILAAPAVWTGLELARADVLTGMAMASLGHTQYRWIELIQISDLAGAYGVGFLVMFVAACLARMLPCDGHRRAVWPLVPAAVARWLPRSSTATLALPAIIRVPAAGLHLSKAPLTPT